MTTTRIQLRGHCQACGRVQAVRNGRIAKHGYTVDYGWFNGTCQGAGHEPIETKRFFLDQLTERMVQRANVTTEIVMALQLGARRPEQVRTNKHTRQVINGRTRFAPVMVSWDEATEYQRAEEVKRSIYDLQYEEKCLRRDVEAMRALADAVHGAALYQVQLAA